MLNNSRRYQPIPKIIGVKYRLWCPKSIPKLYDNEKLKFYIGDVRDTRSIDDAMNGVDYVFHAAALKQVPSCEFYPMQAVQTNVIGTENILNAAIKAGVKKLIALSTDKASAPINLYGATKLASDKIFISANNIVGKQDTRFSVVRYGNVFGSRGSVVPLFLSLKNDQDFFPIKTCCLQSFWRN